MRSNKFSHFEQGQEQVESTKLSPEQIETILKKAEDINQEGVAYTRINRYATEFNMGFDGPGRREHRSDVDSYGNIRETLQQGILGGRPLPREFPTPTTWKESVRGKNYYGGKMTPSQVVHFNVVGRAKDIKKEKGQTQMSQDFYMSNAGSIGIIFDISKFNELKTDAVSDGADGILIPEVKAYHFKHAPVSHPMEEPLRNHELGKSMPGTNFGFILSPRIAPRLFKGIVFNGPPSGEKNQRGDDIPELRPEILRVVAEKIHQEMVKAYGDNSEKLLPIYDVNGNLWWPKELPHEELAKEKEE